MKEFQNKLLVKLGMIVKDKNFVTAHASCSVLVKETFTNTELALIFLLTKVEIEKPGCVGGMDPRSGSNTTARTV